MLLLMHDEQVIEARPSHNSQEALTYRIGTWGVRGGFEQLDATGLGNPREGHPKLSIVITDEVLRSHPIGCGLPKLLRRLSVSGRARHADVDHFARVQIEDEESEQ